MPRPPRNRSRGPVQPPKRPQSKNRDAEGAPAKGSILAPLLPRRYLDGRVETILPKAFSMFRQWLIILGIAIMLALNFLLLEQYGYELYGVRLGYAIVAGIIILHIVLIAYSFIIYSKYVRFSVSGAVMASRTTVNLFQSLTVKFILLVVASIAGYGVIFYFFGKGIFASALSEEAHDDWRNGLLLMSYAFLLCHFLIMRMKPDQLACFTQEFWVSGIYKVPLSEVGSMRVVSRASPNFLAFGLSSKEKKVYFEVYDKESVFMGRDIMFEGEFDAIDEIMRTRGYKTYGTADIKIPQRRYAQTKKKKNPVKKK